MTLNVISCLPGPYLNLDHATATAYGWMCFQRLNHFKSKRDGPCIRVVVSVFMKYAFLKRCSVLSPLAHTCLCPRRWANVSNWGGTQHNIVTFWVSSLVSFRVLINIHEWRFFFEEFKWHFYVLSVSSKFQITIFNSVSDYVQWWFEFSFKADVLPTHSNTYVCIVCLRFNFQEVLELLKIVIYWCFWRELKYLNIWGNYNKSYRIGFEYELPRSIHKYWDVIVGN